MSDRCGGTPGHPGTLGGEHDGASRWFCEGCEDCRADKPDLAGMSDRARWREIVSAIGGVDIAEKVSMIASYRAADIATGREQAFREAAQVLREYAADASSDGDAAESQMLLEIAEDIFPTEKEQTP